jgi:L-aminopeptidase/D-esterase-like protein
MSQPSFSTLPQPVTRFDGSTLEFDFPGLEVGCAEYEEGPTGCTVFQSATVATDVRGGLPGVFMAGLEAV